MEVLHVMPDEFLRRYSARQIAEIMAYYRLKHEEHERQQQQQNFQQERQGRTRPGRRRR